MVTSAAAIASAIFSVGVPLDVGGGESTCGGRRGEGVDVAAGKKERK